MPEIPKSISMLEPKSLWNWFNTICSIPHPSKHEAALKKYIIDWAEQQKIECAEDVIGNLILRKPASKGMSDAKPVVLQAHLDMVPQANSDKNHDFVTDPIKPLIFSQTESDITDLWVKADGTTLGADNGIGMASALAVLAADDIAHPDLEVLLTVDEEAGMTGAFGLKADTLNAEILINTDSEQEGEIYMGCAGGADAEVSFKNERVAVAEDSIAFRLDVAGLKGGHSGCNIHLGRANAIKLISRFCYMHHVELELAIADISGGTLRNAIPRESQVCFTLPAYNSDLLIDKLQTYRQLIVTEYGVADDNIELTLTEINMPESVFNPSLQARLLAFLQASPDGVIRMSDEFSNVVETSVNLGILETLDEQINAISLVRSLANSSRDNVQNMIGALAKLSRSNCVFSGAYPGWKPDANSEVMAIVREVYEDLYHKKPDIMVIHAGLECGLFKEPYPDMDMVSIGPTIRYPHSPDEKVNVRTVNLYWQLLLALLKNIPKKNAG